MYGTRGVAAAGNNPGARWSSGTWIDSSGKLYLFGGSFQQGSSYGYLNDLWQFDPTTGMWTWLTGIQGDASGENGDSGIYGTQGVPSVDNTPGGRDYVSTWIDTSNHLYLFGGYVENGVDGDIEREDVFNDLWEFDPSAGTWTWLSGSNSVTGNNNTVSYVTGVYGTLGVAAAGNVPGSRQGAYSPGANSGIVSSGNLWLFGGGFQSYGGFADNLTPASYNDLWEYNLSTGLWTWEGGSQNAVNANGVYGTEGVAAAGNIPGARDEGASWADHNGNMWLFGGEVGSFDSAKDLNDLWKFTP